MKEAERGNATETIRAQYGVPADQPRAEGAEVQLDGGGKEMVGRGDRRVRRRHDGILYENILPHHILPQNYLSIARILATELAPEYTTWTWRK